MGSATNVMLKSMFQEKIGVLTRERPSVVFASQNDQHAGSVCAPRRAPRRRPAFTKATTSPVKPTLEDKPNLSD